MNQQQTIDVQLLLVVLMELSINKLVEILITVYVVTACWIVDE